MSPMQQMLLGSSGGVNAIDFIGMPSSGSNTYDSRSVAAYDSKGNIITWYKYNNFTLVKIKPDGTVDWKRGFASWSAGFMMCSIDVGYNDITICASLSSGTTGGLMLWGVSKTGALLWNKKYQVDYTNFNHSSVSAYSNGRPCIRAMTTDDIAILALPIWDISASGNGQPQTSFLTIKCTDGTKIGWGQTRPTTASDPYAMQAHTFSAFLPAGSTTGYWGIVAYDSYSGTNTLYNAAKSWRFKGRFYTAGHSGSKDITVSPAYTSATHKKNLTSTGGVDITDCDCIKDSTGTDIDSVTTYVGNETSKTGGNAYTYGAILNGNWATTFGQFQTPGNCSNMRVARKTQGGGGADQTYFIASNDNQASYSYKVALTKITNGSIIWSRSLQWYVPNGGWAVQNVWCRNVVVDTKGDKGMLIMSYNNQQTDLIIAQFDTGDTAPPTGTYTLSNGGKVAISNNNATNSGYWLAEGWVVVGMTVRTGTGSNNFQWLADTWASQTFQDKSVDFIKEDWD